MGLITDLENRLEVIKSLTDLKEVVHDRIEQINANAANSYPYLLFRVMDEQNDDTGRTRQTVNLTIDFYLADTWFIGDKQTLGQKQDYLSDLLEKVIISVPDKTSTPRQNSFELNRSSRGEYFWDSHNDKVVVLKRTVTISGFKGCVDAV